MSSSAPPLHPSTLERRIIPAPGVDLACWHRPGDGSRWILWLHGACGNHLMWGPQFDRFDGADLLFLDVRGQGESPMHTGRRVALHDAVDDIGRVLDAYGVDRAVLVGHSWGGNPAQEYAFLHPERTDGLVLVGTWGQHRRLTAQEARTIKVSTQIYRVIPWNLLATYSGRWASTEPATQAAVADAIRQTGRQVFLDLGTSGYRAVHEVDHYPVPTPTLLLRGERDSPKVLDAIYADLCAKNPGARQVVIPGTGHQPMLDVPDEFNRIIEAFLAELDELDVHQPDVHQPDVHPGTNTRR